MDPFEKLIKEYAYLFGIDAATWSANMPTFFSEYYYPEQNRQGGVAESSVSFEKLQQLRTYYDANNFDAFKEAIENIDADYKGRTVSANSTTQMLTAFEQNLQAQLEAGTITQEMKDIQLDIFVRGLQNMVVKKPVIKVGQVDANGVPIFDVVETDEFGNTVTKAWSGHFPEGMEGVYEENMSSQDIMEFQDLLEETGIVPTGTFDSTRGRKSDKLRTEFAKLMLYIDTNFYAVPGTSEYNVVNSKDPVYFTDDALLTGNDLFLKKLLGHGLQEYVKDVENNKKVMERLATQERLAQYMDNIPGELEREAAVEDYWMVTYGYQPSPKQLSDWSKSLAQSYWTEFDQVNNAYNRLKNIDMIETPQGTFQPDPEQFEELGIDSAAAVFAQKQQEEMGEELDLAGRAAQKRKMNYDVLRMMLNT